ncbi:hypothetical protein EVAR_97981_1 [Eumeta japonica]|uniref:Uncharacterized protein n=1 Tax=Eumeta variegata TaxID=151549 RepID=A0A4C1XFY8_EUMVA|nr:hypothetical protein EVAR_97981_1 [Eumeta japonica]
MHLMQVSSASHAGVPQLERDKSIRLLIPQSFVAQHAPLSGTRVIGLIETSLVYASRVHLPILILPHESGPSATLDPDLSPALCSASRPGHNHSKQIQALEHRRSQADGLTNHRRVAGLTRSPYKASTPPPARIYAASFARNYWQPDLCDAN